MHKDRAIRRREKIPDLVSNAGLGHNASRATVDVFNQTDDQERPTAQSLYKILLAVRCLLGFDALRPPIVW